MENDDGARDDMMVDLDLNQQPSDPPVESVLQLGSLLSDLETAHGQIEQRIRQLEAVTARARQRQRWRQARNPPEIIDISVEQNAGREGELPNGQINAASLEGVDERCKSCKRDSSHLVAKALEMDMDVKKGNGDGGSFFDCNICFETAKEPILTCCGHLFCWACFYQLPYVYSSAKECPMCKGEVIETNVTPIYGNGNKTHKLDSEASLKLPPRPQAHRIESVRQQRVNRGVSHVPVAEALRRIRTGIGSVGERHPRQDLLEGISESSGSSNMAASQVPASVLLRNTEAGGSMRLRPHQFSRVLSESAASLSSISSALNDAERLVDNLESYIHDRFLPRSDAPLAPVNAMDPLMIDNTIIIQPEHQNVYSTTQIDSSVPLPLASRRTGSTAALVPMENLSTETPNGINIDLSRPSSSRRRRGISRVSDSENGVSRAPRRRRLR